MEFYVSGKVGAEDDVKTCIQHLLKAGHEITLDWTKIDACKPYDEDIVGNTKIANEMILGIEDADVFVLIPHSGGEGCETYINVKWCIGMYVELGIALGLGMPVCIITKDEFRSIFYCQPSVKILDSVDELIEEFAD